MCIKYWSPHRVCARAEQQKPKTVSFEAQCCYWLNSCGICHRFICEYDTRQHLWRIKGNICCCIKKKKKIQIPCVCSTSQCFRRHLLLLSQCTRTFSRAQETPTSMLLLLLLSLEISHPSTPHTALWSRQHKSHHHHHPPSPTNPSPQVTNESAGFWCLRSAAKHAHVHTAGGDGRRAEGFIIIADFGAEGLLLNKPVMWGQPRDRLF